MVRKMWMFVAVMLFAGVLAAPLAFAQDKPAVRSTWGAIKALYRGSTENPSESQQAEPLQAGVKKPGAEVAASTCYGWKFPFLGRWQISCFYGPYGGSSYHDGQDYYALDWNLPGEQDFNQYVVAPAGGGVLFAGYSSGYGNQVLVNAGGGRIYRVAHLNSISVGANMSIGQGAILGRCGRTGSAEGSHIHFVVYVNATYLGSGRVSGTSIPQDGISGSGNLARYQYYNSYQWMSTP